MLTRTELRSSLGLLVVSAAVCVGAAAGCDRIDDVLDDVLKARDGGTDSDARPSAPPVCTTDMDCRAVADYCTGCDCRALGAKEPDPVCGGPGVQCFVDPCLNKTAACRAGRCVIAPPTPTACLSGSDCAADELCTTETGTCNRPPGCGPNDACPAVCYGTCQPRVSKGEACGPKTCEAGMVCCNASCGICTRPGGACTQQFCQ